MYFCELIKKDGAFMPQAKLSGQLKDCYKIKLHQASYRLVYQVNDSASVVAN
jgi:mRNA interferase RelE/StbE